MLAPLFALALALPATGQPLHLELSLSGSVWYNGNSPLGPTPGATELGGGPQLDVNWYPRPIVDDDAAPSLQPFLQRATVLQVNGGGGRTDLTWPVALSPLSGPPMVRTYGNGGAGVAASGYFGPRRMLFAAGSFRVLDQNESGAGTQSLLQLPIDVSFGVRLRDLLVRASWGVVPRQLDAGTFTVPFWGNAGVHGSAVVARRLELAADGYVLDGGGSGGGGARLWLARRLGIGASIFGGHFAPSGSNVQDFVDGTLDAFAWVTRRVGLGTAYTLEWRQLSDGQSLGKVYSSSLQHLVMLSIVTRPF